MLAELEEVIEYKLSPERQPVIREMWWRRLQGCNRSVEDWQRVMSVRSLVISPQTDQRTWLKYSSLCRGSGRLHLSRCRRCSRGHCCRPRPALVHCRRR